MKAQLVLILVAVVLALCGNAQARQANREGDGGMGSALFAVILYFIAAVFVLVAILRFFLGH